MKVKAVFNMLSIVSAFVLGVVILFGLNELNTFGLPQFLYWLLSVSSLFSWTYVFSILSLKDANSV